MKNKIYTFKDLKFETKFSEYFSLQIMQAKLFFENGFGVSVIYGEACYSENLNGVQTYELMPITPSGSFLYDDPLGYLTENEVSEEMIRIQKINTGKQRISEEDPYGEEMWDD